MRYVLTVWAFLMVLNLKAQDPTTSQLNATPLVFSPGFAGSQGSSRAFAGYRTQWPSLSAAFNTLNIAYDQRVNFLHGGVGLRMMHDVAGEGTLKNLYIGGMYSFQWKINDKVTIAPGVEFGIIKKTIDFSKLTFGDMIDPRYGFIYQTQTQVSSDGLPPKFDLSAGLTVYSKTWFVGLSAYHITQPKESKSSNAYLPMKLSAIIGADFKVSEKFNIMPCFLYQKQQIFNQFVFSQNFRIAFAIFGAGFRANAYNFASTTFNLGYQSNSFRFLYSYDLTVSKLSNKTGGSHELSVSFLFNRHNKADKVIAPRYWGGQ